MSVCCVCFIFDCVGELFAICVGEVNAFSLKFIVFFCCWPIRVLSYKEYVCGVCDPSVCLRVTFVCLYEACDFRV